MYGLFKFPLFNKVLSAKIIGSKTEYVLRYDFTNSTFFNPECFSLSLLISIRKLNLSFDTNFIIGTAVLIYVHWPMVYLLISYIISLKNINQIYFLHFLKQCQYHSMINIAQYNNFHIKLTL